MNIFSFKYKAHRFVNYIFYIIVFFFGFLVGVGAKKIDIKSLIPNILMIDNVDAFTIYSDNNVTIDESFVYNTFLDHYSNFSLDTTPYIYCTKFSNRVECRTFSTLDYLYNGQTNPTNYKISRNSGSFIASTFTYTYDTRAIQFLNDYGYSNHSWSASSSFSNIYFSGTTPTYSNFNISLISGIPTTHNSDVNKLDFTPLLTTTYMTIDYLDSSYNVISSTDCIDNTMDYCSLSINSNTGSYIKITYFLDELINRRLDFLPNSTYRLKTTLIGSNLDTRVSYINPWFYFNGSTQNVDSDLLVATNKSISYFDDSFSYSSDFSIDDEYNSYSVYEISVFYNTNSSYYSTISIPYEFSLSDVTSGDTPIVQPTIPDDNINKDDIIIDQNSQLINNQNITNQNLSDINNSINNDNINGASSQASSFFSSFNTDSHGLTGIITAPLNLISSITSTTCSPLVLPIPFVNTNLTLPCLSSIYSQYFGSFLTIYQSITFGIVAYWVCVRIFNLVKDFKNPDHDEIEVLDL